MFNYPQLSHAEEAGLPKLMAQPSVIPNKFEDSTHQLFDCQTANGAMVLKVCNTPTIEKSHFWLGANHLFAADFPNNLGNIDLTHHFLQKNGALGVPEFVAASANRFVLTRFVEGTDVDARQIKDDWVIQLANHIAKLHQLSYSTWGTLHAPQFSANAWASRLHDTLVYLTEQQQPRMAKDLLPEVLAQAAQCHASDFVPMMLDLRWDQFRCLNTNQLVLIDLDAFVIAPRALDLVLLEYILTPSQLVLFKQHYTQTHAWIEYSAHTPAYQLLLFLMNILGETDLVRWMRRI